MSKRARAASSAGLVLTVILAAAVAPLGAQEQKKIPLGVRLSDVSINKVPFLVADREGLYAKYGLEVSLIPFSEDAAKVHGVPDNVSKNLRDAASKMEISVGGGAPGMVEKVTQSEPNDRVILATTDAIVHWNVVARKGINKVEELKGKTIAISSLSACTGTVALVLAKHMGWDPVQDVALLEGNYSITPLQKGWADALIAYEVPLAMAMKAGYKPLDLDMRAWNEPIPCNGVWASKSWAHANHDTVIRFLKALTEAIAMMKKDKEVAFRSIAHYYAINDREQQQVIYNGAAEMPRKPYPAVDGIQNAMKLYDSAAMRRYKATDFYDDSFMKELDSSGFIDSLYK